MPVFDTPVTANDASLERVLAQPLPVVVMLGSQRDQSLQHAMERLASEYAGKALIIRINPDENPRAYERFGKPALPAIVTIREGQDAAKTEAASISDLESHIKFALGLGSMPPSKMPSHPRSAHVTNTPIHITDAAFEKEVLESSIPVLVDFWAPWCGPCHMIAPVLDRLAQTYAGRIRIVKLNVDENPNTAGLFQISGIPHLMLFKSGQMVGRLVGAHPQQNIEQLINQNL
jgi:thioredoxin 1